MQTYHSFLAVLREAKDGVSILVVKIIKEDAATASSFIVAVFDHKVVITPLLELRPVLRVVLLTNSLSNHTLLHQTVASNCSIRHGAQVVTCRPLMCGKCCQHLSLHCKTFAAT